MRWILGILLSLAPLGLPHLAQAAVVCDVATSGVAFGSYDAIGDSSRDTSGTITVTCSGTIGDSVRYSILLNTGMGSYNARTLAAGGTNLAYNLYVDAGTSQVWGDGTGGTTFASDSYTLAQSSVTRQYTIYGRIPVGQNRASAGNYLDGIVVTLNY